MDTAKAIQLLHRLQDEQFDGIHGDERREALEMAVRALSGEGDTISRQSVIDAITEIDDGTNMDIYTNEVRELLRELPSAQPECKTGRWIYGEHDVAMCDGYWCDKCGFFVPWDYQHKSIDFIKDYHFCPNCGARMEAKA